MDLRSQLKTYLNVDYQTQSNEGKSSDNVRLLFTVTNGSQSPSDSSPSIVYKDVVLKVRTSSGKEVVKLLGQLKSRESATNEVDLKYSELVDMEYEVYGTVDPESFFRIQRNEKLRPDKIKVPIAAYIKAVENSSLVRWKELVVDPFPLIGPETTVRVLEDARTHLAEARRQFQQDREMLQKLAGMVAESPARAATIEHSRAVEVFVNLLLRGSAQIDQSLNSSGLRNAGSSIKSFETTMQKAHNPFAEQTHRLLAFV